MAGRSRPVAEVDVDESLVRALLADQMEDVAGLPLELVASGFDNVIFRLGDELCVRLPRRSFAAELVDHEQRWLPTLAARLPLPVPAPVRAGRPALGYPWSWSVCPWLPGRPALEEAPVDLARTAEALGGFLRQLHVEAPPDAPVSRARGVPLRSRDESVREFLPLVAGLDPALDLAALTGAWNAALAVPDWDGPRRWTHGDMHPGNVLVHEGRVSAVIDFGDLNGGDRATDLAIAWMLFDRHDRDVFRDALGEVDPGTWRRGRGWGLFFGVVLLAHSGDNADFGRLGSATLRRILADA